MRLPQDRILHIDTEFENGKVNVVAEWQGELVRCKDCKHHEKFCFDDSKLLCWVHDIDIVVSPTDYCSYAERRAESEVKE